MRYIRFNSMRGQRSTNPIVQAFGLIIGIILFIAAVFVGGIMIAALLGFMLLAGLVIYLRIWWLTRKAGLRQRREDESFVEAEYQVIDTSADETSIDPATTDKSRRD
jgi:hypothetical protein